MSVKTEPNYMMEALAFLSFRANPGVLEARLQKGVLNAYDAAEARRIADSVRELFSAVDRLVPTEEEEAFYFSYLKGMQEGHPIGYSLASILCFNAASIPAPLDEQRRSLVGLTREDAMRSAAACFLNTEKQGADAFEFFDLISGLPVPDEDKLRIIELCSHPEDHVGRLERLIFSAAAAIRESIGVLAPVLREFASMYNDGKNTVRLLNSEDVFGFPEGCLLELEPMLFNASFIMVTEKDGDFYVDMGVMRHLINKTPQTATSEEETLTVLKTLSDPSRLKIVKALLDGEAYGHELAKRLGLYSTTISHHMAKLTNCGLVKCRLEANKAYYSIDKKSVLAFISNLTEILSPRD